MWPLLSRCAVILKIEAIVKASCVSQIKLQATDACDTLDSVPCHAGLVIHYCLLSSNQPIEQ